MFDLSFSNDPRLLLPQFAPQTYGWQDFDPRDNYANNALYHGGHLVLTGSRNPYSFVNLSTPIGPNSVGVVLPRIGGDSQGTGGTQPGWTFELIVKVNSQEQWAKLLDWGNGPDADNIIFGYNANSRQLEFQVVNNALTPRGDFRLPVITQTDLGFWYHIAIVAVPISVSSFTAVYSAYVDGVLVRTMNGLLPQNVPRRSALLGRSNWEFNGDGMFAANIDAIRVYDYALSAPMIASLYALANGPGGPRPRPAVSSSSSTAAPVVRRFSSSTSAPVARKRCDPAFTTGGYEPCTCAWGGKWPSQCWCPNSDDGDYPWGCPYADATAESSSTGVAPPATTSGTSTRHHRRRGLRPHRRRRHRHVRVLQVLPPAGHHHGHPGPGTRWREGGAAVVVHGRAQQWDDQWGYEWAWGDEWERARGGAQQCGDGVGLLPVTAGHTGDQRAVAHDGGATTVREEGRVYRGEVRSPVD